MPRPCACSARPHANPVSSVSRRKATASAGLVAKGTRSPPRRQSSLKLLEPAGANRRVFRVRCGFCWRCGWFDVAGLCGGVAERLNAPASKAGGDLGLPRVQISPPPQSPVTGLCPWLGGRVAYCAPLLAERGPKGPPRVRLPLQPPYFLVRGGTAWCGDPVLTRDVSEVRNLGPEPRKKVVGRSSSGRTPGSDPGNGSSKLPLPASHTVPVGGGYG